MKDIEDLVGLFKEFIINSVADHLEKIMTVTDFGVQLDNKNRQVYRSHISIKIDAVQDTPVDVCSDSSSPVKTRRESDKERLKILASELIGFL